MKSVAGLTVLSLAQANMLRHATPARHVHFLGSGKNHSNEIFHAVISAQNLNAVEQMKVSYYDCGDDAGCATTNPIVNDKSLRASAFNITETGESVTNTGESDEGYYIFDVEYDNTNGPTVNHLLTVFSDGLGEESIICGTNKSIDTENGGCVPCGDGQSDLYAANCTCFDTCSADQHYVAHPEGYACGTCACDITSNDNCTVPGQNFTAGDDDACGTCVCVITSNDHCNDVPGQSFKQGDNGACGTCACDITSNDNCNDVPGQSFKQGDDDDACGTCVCDITNKDQCVQGQSFTQGDDDACGTCVCDITSNDQCDEGMKYQEPQGGNACGTCVAKSKMFGYVIVTRDDGINDGCCSVCASWYGQLEQGFNQTADINRLQADNEICGLLKTDGPMIASSQAAVETACNIFTEQVQCGGV